MELFEHQKTGIDFLKRNPKAILADEMGLGKTRQAIIAVNETRRAVKFAMGGAVERIPGALVVCPASLKINWMREILAVDPTATIEIISTTEEMQTDPRKVEWFIINYDILEKKIELINSLISESMIDTLILDEAHYIKGKTKRAACIIGGTFKSKKKIVLSAEELEKIAMGFMEAPNPVKTQKFDGIANKMARVYCLTGTPLLNRPIEMFNLLKAIGHPLGNLRMFYSKKYCGGFLQTIIRKSKPPLRIWNEQGATNLADLRQQLKGTMIRRKKDEVLNLPEKIVSVVECEMEKEWQKEYDNAWDKYLDFLEANPIPDRNIDNILMARHLVEIQKLKQVCSKSKIKRIVKDIENAIEQDEKVVIFSQYTETIRMLAQEIKQLKYDTGELDYMMKPLMRSVGVATLTGEDDMMQRQAAVDTFQKNPTVKVFIANIKAGGVGITLTEASQVMFADMDWSPETHNQAIDRTHRIGQKKMVNAYFYICEGTIEEDIIEILDKKKDVLNKILEEGGAENIWHDRAQSEFLHKIASKSGVDKV
jgi:SWI/SNF-related matrix-associated actin-dependent regulator of chromatin subfamily A-like protein 1